MEKTHYRKLMNPDYIGAYELMKGEDPIDLNVKIVNVVQKEVVANGGVKDICLVAELEGQKPMIINSTNAKMISKLVGSPYIEDWAGVWITLYVAEVKFGRDIVDALRVRNTLPKKSKAELKEGHPRWEGALEAIKQGNVTLADLKRNFKLSDETIKILEQHGNI